MRIKVLLTLLTFSLSGLNLGAQTVEPNEFLPHDIGEEFTPHHLLVDYMYHVAETNSNVLIQEYGRTNQKRPLLNLIISSQENIDNIEKIRLNNLYRAGLSEGKSFPDVDDIVIVWLSFSVHGNEASGSESSMPIIYELVSGKDSQSEKWLENTVVIYDPSINPDGYSRYTHWHRNVAEKNKSPEVEDREHSEPWPGGRVNHYLFDLNRDWAWQTQVESQQRMQVYNNWLPQVHVDFHEMGSNNPYYFAPAAAPYHDYITDWQGEFQETIGRNHAKYFDKEGWLYFTREVYDLFYPSYGDTYPTFNGAIGMTYEQGGGSRAGRAIKTANGEVLTLHDRINHHYTTALSTIEVASLNSRSLIEEFKKFYKQDAPGRYKSYLVKGSNKDKIRDLAQLLDKQDISYTWAAEGAKGSGFSYTSLEEEDFTSENGDLLVSTDQAKKTLVQVLMDPKANLEDSLTYDITAWALPYAYGLEAFAIEDLLEVEVYDGGADGSAMSSDDYYAIVIAWNSLESVKLISQLHQREVTMRLSSIPFTIDGEEFGRNSIVITRADNRSLEGDLLEKLMEAGAKSEDFKLVQTGFSQSGADLGSSKMRLIAKPEVLVLSGEETSRNSFGQVWYYFEQVADYPLTIMDVDRISDRTLSNYNTLVMTDGYYGFSDGDLKLIREWVRNGGKVISIGSANRSFADKDGFALKTFATDDEKKEAKKAREEAALIDRFHQYEGSERRRIINNVPGAIFEVSMDETHPLSYGIGDSYFSLKTSNLNYRPLKGAQNVGVVKADAKTIGFIGSSIKDRLAGSIDFAIEDQSRGTIIYMVDNPLFRGFWREGQLLFSNALFLVN